MAYNTVIQQGYFTSDGLDKVIPLKSGADWVEVTNLTNIAASDQWDGYRWYWQSDMDQNDAVVEYHGAASQLAYISTTAIGFNGNTFHGISTFDSSYKTPGAAVAVTGGTDVVQPTYTTADTGFLQNGAVVRLNSTDQTGLNGLDFSLDTVHIDVDFLMSATLATAQGIVAGANGYYRYIAPNVDYYDMFHPKKRVICNITQAAAGVVTTLVYHNYTSGDKVRIQVPEGRGMVELNDQVVTVTNINNTTFSINVDTTAYTAFNFPTAALFNGGDNVQAQVYPVGVELENTAQSGIILRSAAGAVISAASPGGSNGDAIKWRAGKSFAYDIG